MADRSDVWRAPRRRKSWQPEISVCVPKDQLKLLDQTGFLLTARLSNFMNASENAINFVDLVKVVCVAVWTIQVVCEQ
jgi:hypothetical protein